MAENSINERVQAVKEITRYFWLERLIYLIVIVICLIILIVTIIVAAKRGEAGTVEISSMCGSGGVISIMTGRLLHMWNRAMSFLEK